VALCHRIGKAARLLSKEQVAYHYEDGYSTHGDHLQPSPHNGVWDGVSKDQSNAESDEEADIQVLGPDLAQENSFKPRPRSHITEMKQAVACLSAWAHEVSP
jgi:hypothetical protein